MRPNAVRASLGTFARMYDDDSVHNTSRSKAAVIDIGVGGHDCISRQNISSAQTIVIAVHVPGIGLSHAVPTVYLTVDKEFPVGTFHVEIGHGPGRVDSGAS